VAETKPLDRIDSHVVHEHVDGWEDTPERGCAVRFRKIEAQGALVAIERKEDRAHTAMKRYPVRAHHVARRTLDLYDVRAEVGQDERGERPQHDRCQIEHANAGERTFRLCGFCLHSFRPAITSPAPPALPAFGSRRLPIAITLTISQYCRNDI